jgi:hypothetical protein
MITASHQACARSRTFAWQALIGLAVLLPVCACSSSSSSSSAATSVTSVTAATAACDQVSAVLADGPDPDADPVGYAQAQILPLRQIRTSDATVGKAIVTLAGAYSSYSAANGTNKTITATLNGAINRINALCPGAGATT